MVSSNPCQLLLLLLAFTSVVQGRQLTSAVCPAGCEANKCVPDKTSGQYKCTKCKAGMMLFKSSSPDGSADQGSCGCKAGKYWNASDANGVAKCNRCSPGRYCTGGAAAEAVEQPCPEFMTTVNKGATSKWQCVPLPGYGYGLWIYGGSPQPRAEPCTGNTYSTGYNKRGCVACPAGYTVPAGADHRLPGACRVPAGYYLRLPGEVAPCPQGEYRAQSDPAAKCLPCPGGTTTEPAKDRVNEGLEWCTTLKPGYFAVKVEQIGDSPGATGHTHYILKALPCPQRHWCPGGKPSESYTDYEWHVPSNHAATRVFRCSQEYGAAAGTADEPLWTKSTGAESKDQCLVPPGYEVDERNAVMACRASTFREGWARPTSNVKCDVCATGEGISTMPSENLIKYHYRLTDATQNQYILEEEAIPIAAYAGSCVLLEGFGMYVEGSGFVTEPCKYNCYGAPEPIYGQAVQPCRPCPTNMVTPLQIWSPQTERWNYGFDMLSIRGNWINPLACQTQSGYGYDGHVSMKCPKGTYNPGGNREECKPCPWGYTTSEDEAAVDSTACVVAPGFQKASPVDPVEECPVGTYSDSPANSTEEYRLCTPCADNKATMDTGSDSASDGVGCLPGYGTLAGDNAEGSPCYECGSDMLPGYGPKARLGTQCVACPEQTAYTVFTTSLGETVSFTSPAVIKPGQTSAAGCVAEFAMIEPPSLVHKRPESGSIISKYPYASTVQECAEHCRNMSMHCLFFTFQFNGDNGAGECFTATWLSSPESWELTGYLAFKAVPSGDQATSSSAAAALDASASNITTAKAMASGLYTYYRVSASFVASIAEDAVQQHVQTNSKSQCLKACNMDSTCAAAWLQRDGWGQLDVPDATDDNITACNLYKALGVAQSPQGDELVLTVSFVKVYVQFLA